MDDFSVGSIVKIKRLARRVDVDETGRSKNHSSVLRRACGDDSAKSRSTLKIDHDVIGADRRVLGQKQLRVVHRPKPSLAGLRSDGYLLAMEVDNTGLPVVVGEPLADFRHEFTFGLSCSR